MITAHLPSGYILSHMRPVAPLVLPAALIGAILPDFDLIWFYFIDNRAFHHHKYWVHAPGFWLMVAPLIILFTRVWAQRYFHAAVTFFLAICLHLLLDLWAGSLMLFWPFSEQLFAVVEVPARQSHWLLSFILHWSFIPEIVIWITAFTLWLRRNKI